MTRRIFIERREIGVDYTLSVNGKTEITAKLFKCGKCGRKNQLVIRKDGFASLCEDCTEAKRQRISDIRQIMKGYGESRKLSETR